MAKSPRPSETFLFFVSAVSYSIGWTSISSELGRLSVLFGPGILLRCNLAYFLPSFLINGSQLLLDEYFDAKYGWFRSNCWRDVTGFGGCALLAASYPFLPETEAWLLAFIAGLGCCSSLAFGASSEVAAHRPSGDSMALSLGFVCSGPLVLAVEAALRMGPHASGLQILALYEFVAIVCTCGLAAALLAQWRIWQLHRSSGGTEGAAEPLLAASRRDMEQGQGSGAAGAVGASLILSSSRGPPATPAANRLAHSTLQSASCAVLDDPSEVESAGGGPGAGPPAPSCSSGSSSSAGSGGVYWQVLRRAWPAAAALAIGVGTSMLLFPLFPYVKGEGRLGMMLPQAMFWVRVFCDILGRIVPRFWLMTSPLALLLLALIKLSLTPLLPFYIQGNLPLLPGYSSDAAVLVFVGVQWVLSGYLSSCSQVAAPGLVPMHLQCKAASAMALVFQGACLVGLLAALPIRGWAPSS